MKISRTIRFSVVAALFTISASAQAGYISGNLAFFGTVIPTGGTSLDTATGLQFNAPQHTSSKSSENTGSFAGLDNLDFTMAAVTNFDPLAPAPLDSFKVGNITVTLENYVANTLTQTGNNLGVTYDALLSGTGFTDTAGRVNFSVSYSGGTSYADAGTVYATPLPAAILFVAPALGGLFGWSRRKSSKSSMA